MVTHHLESSVQDSWRGRAQMDLEGRLGAPLCQWPTKAGSSPENHSDGRTQAWGQMPGWEVTRSDRSTASKGGE